MNARWLLPAPLLAFVLTGCLTPPTQTDPFADISVAKRRPPAGFPDLSLAIVPTPSALKSLEYARKANALNMGKYDMQKPVNDLMLRLRGDFRSVVKVDSAEEARAQGVDLVGMFDYYLSFPNWASGEIDIRESLLLLDGTGAAVDKVTAEVKAPVSERSHWNLLGSVRAQEAFENISRDVLDRFLENLAASAPLRDLEKTRAARAPAAVPTAAAPAAAPARYSDVDRADYKAPEDPSKFALVVGIEGYESLPPAEYAERDAAAVRQHLLALGYPERNLVYLTGQKAGRSGIAKYVESWLPRNVDENSRVFVYFSGHGAPDPKSGEAFLMPWDADAKFLDQTAYPVKRLYDNLGRLKAKRVLVALDSCFSGAGGRSVLPKGARPLVTRVDAGIPESDRLVVLAAASGDEITGADDAQGHGLFTYYLLKGLNDRKGSGTVRSLYESLKPKVQDAARRDNRDQTPQLLPATGGGGERF